ncbi:MAG: Tyrocidine synthase 3 [Candidatus Celerinatantimonas neptuna]|nr:MAG: Tyrocidine synthase 3 [Candidatus Celerinatantimonas neptuna]
MQDTFFQYEASLAQRRLWLLQQLEPESANYHIPTLLEMTGLVDSRILQEALDQLVARHEAFRTDFCFEENSLWQCCHDKASVNIETHDLQSLDEMQQAHAIDDVRDRPFDLTCGPLVRVALFQCAEQRYQLLFVLHHIISDGWSAGIISREIAKNYNAIRKGESVQWPELSIQYIDYTAWQQEQMASEAYQESLLWWQKQLGGIEPVELPTDFARPARLSSQGQSYRFVLPEAISYQLAERSKAQRKTLFNTLLSAFYLLLYRYSGQTDLVVGSPIAGRGLQQLEDVVGFFVNTLVYRIDLAESQSFSQLQEQVFDMLLASFEHQQVSFDQLVETINPERDLSYSPLFQVMFSFDEYEPSQWQFDEIDCKRIERLAPYAKYDLTLAMEKQGEHLCGVFEYSTDLFSKETIERICQNFEYLLSEVAVNMEQPLHQYQAIAPVERDLLINQWQRERVSHDVATTLHERFEQQVKLYPHEIALSCVQAEHLTYLQLNQRANQLAHYLLNIESQAKGDLVGICLGRTTDALVAILAVLKAGMAYVPIDDGHAPARIRYYVEDAGLCWVIGSEATSSLFEDCPVDLIDIDAEMGLITTMPQGNPAISVSADDLAYIIYTSGSTGNPKGVMIPHANVLRLFESSRACFEFSHQDVWTLFHSCAFDFSVWEIWGALLNGARLSVVPYWVTRTPERLLKWIQDEKVTILSQTPSAFYQLIHIDQHSDERCKSLHYVVMGGEALDPSALTPWFAKYGDNKPQIINMYGITETTVHVTWQQVYQSDVENAGKSPIGVPLDDLDVFLLDRQQQLVPLGALGEMYIGGAGVAKGYLGRPELTASRFVKRDVLFADATPDETLYRSGDLARFRPDGSLEYLGRADDQVKIRGFRIELGEVEAGLNKLPQVDKALVLVQKEGQQSRLVAFLMCHRPMTTELLREGLKATLPDYMLPSAFHVLEQFPLTINGKVDRKALLALQPQRPELESEYVAARNETEVRLVSLWQDILRIPEVGVHDNFFALGGDSLRGVQFVGAMVEDGWSLSLVDLFQYQSIAELAKVLIARQKEGHVQIQSVVPFSQILPSDREKMPESVMDAYPLSRMQAGMFYHMQLTPDSNVYHCTGSSHLRLAKPLDPEAFDTAVQDTVREHDVLRTAFDLANYSEPLQLVLREARLPVVFEDLRHLSEDAQEERIRERLEIERMTGFDLLKPTLLRFFIYLRDETSFQFVLTECHPVYDGWSYHSLIVEIFNRYAALTGLQDWVAPAKPLLEYRDFIAQEQRLIHTPDQQNWWQRQLQDCTLLKLPHKPGSEALIHVPPVFNSVRVTLEPDVYQGIRQLMTKLAVPLKSVLLAAHIKVMSIFSGESDILTGIPTNGRPEIQGGDQIFGLFLNILPFRQKLSADSWEALIRQTFSQESEAIAYRSFPLAEIQKQFGPQPLLDEAAFNYMDFHVYDRLLPELNFEVASNLSTDRIYEGTHFALSAHFQHYTLTSALVSEQVSFQLDYNANLIDRMLVEDMAACFVEVFHAMVEDSQAIHSELCFVPSHQKPLIENFSKGEFPYQGDESLATLFTEQVANNPQAIALICGDRQLTYQELDEQTNQLAHWLAEKGVGEGVRVALLFERSIELIQLILAVTKLEGIYLAINSEDPAARRNELLSDAQCLILVAAQPYFEEAKANSPVPAYCIDEDKRWQSMPVTALACHDNHRSGLLIYTSGSTGKPKGVLLRQRGVAQLSKNIDYMDYQPGRRFLMVAAVSFDVSTPEIWSPLLNGCTIVVYPYQGIDLPRLSDCLEHHHVDGMMATASLFNLIVDERPQMLAGLKVLMSGGEAMSKRHATQFKSLFPEIELINAYGPTENTTITTTYHYHNTEESSDSGSVPIGKPVSGNDVFILDSFMQPVPIGTPGELYLGGDGLAVDYLNQPERYHDVFVHSVTEPEKLLYRTGDRGMWLPDGNIEFLGRLDDQNKIRGFRIELGEVESVICQHPEVDRAGVVVLQGAKGKRLSACIVTRNDSQLDSYQLREFMLERLPRYMVPVNLYFMDSLPITRNGKLDVSKLKTNLTQENVFHDVQDPIIQKIQLVWSEILDIPLPDPRQNFFDLGGDSLLLTRVQLRLVEAGFDQLTMLDLLNYTTIELLAQHLKGEKNEQADQAIEKVEQSLKKGRSRLLAMQARGKGHE